ncbi:MAG: SIS domain-containing protein [Methanobrevibacter sp.]|nr:SIS domain-containing protein [Candidatus Methanovirga aequatorialis]
MMLIQKLIENALKDMKNLVMDVENDKVNEFIETILNSNRVFTIGVGFSKFAAESCASQLIRNGFDSYLIGNVSTPAVEKEDCVIGFSRSGESEYIVNTFEIARKKIDPKLMSITPDSNSSLGKLSDLNIPIKKFDSTNENLSKNIFPDLFELTSLLFVDAVLLNIIKRTMYNQTVSFE